MIFHMFRMIKKKHKIFNSIVSIDFIDMMHYFFRLKVSSQVFFHNKTRTKNVTSHNGIRMFRFMNDNISLRSFRPSFIYWWFLPFFKTVRIAYHIRTLFSFIPTWFSFSVFVRTFPRTILSTPFNLVRPYIKTFFTYFTDNFNHLFSKIKAVFSGLERTVKSLRLLTARFLGTKNPLSLSNISITGFNNLSTY